MEGVEEPFMSPGRGFVKALHQVVASGFRDIESIFEIEVSMLISSPLYWFVEARVLRFHCSWK